MSRIREALDFIESKKDVWADPDVNTIIAMAGGELSALTARLAEAERLMAHLADVSEYSTVEINHMKNKAAAFLAAAPGRRKENSDRDTRH